MRQTTESVQGMFATLDRRAAAAIVGMALALGAGLVGLAVAALGPLWAAALVAAMGAGVWLLVDLWAGLYASLAVMLLLPFASLPFKLGIRFTFLDVGMGAFMVVYALQWMKGKRRKLITTPLHAPMLLFAALIAISYVFGLRHAPFTTNVARKVAEMVLAILFALLLLDVLRHKDDIRRVALSVAIFGTLLALGGIVLYVLPDALAERLLVTLARFEYPGGGVIRYVEDNPALQERAISTAVDPNALGGILVVIGALIAPNIFAKRPIMGDGTRGRLIALGMFGVTAGCIYLTYSRNALVALGTALGFIALVRYRKLIPLMIAGALLLLLLPQTQGYVARFIEGFQGGDLATQMRFGEYKDALKLIGRYPLVGVGFTAAPDIDIYLGVASMYLLMLSNMGLMGLAAFALVMGGLFAYAWGARKAIRTDSALEPVVLGALAALAGTLAAGILDHYFFSLDFIPLVTLFWVLVGLALAGIRSARDGTTLTR